MGSSTKDQRELNSGSGRDVRALALRVITFLGGIYFFLYFIIPESVIESTGIKSANEAISNGFIAVGSMAIGLGIINIFAAHGAKLAFLKSGWQYSAALLLGLIVMVGSTIAQWLATNESARHIREVQIIGDFATRIVEDAKLAPDKQLSYSPNGELPLLATRVAALESYTKRVIDKINKEGAALTRRGDTDAATRQLVAESEQEVVSLNAALVAIGTTKWEQLDASTEAVLGQIGQKAAKVASSYAILKRKDGQRLFSSRLYDFLYDGLFNHLGASMFALLGVYIAAAAYRAFRIQTFESALMMLAALVVMLGQISFGKMIYEDMPSIRQWLLEVPNSAAFRAIRLGAGVAGLMLAIRMWLSIESAKNGGEKE